MPYIGRYGGHKYEIAWSKGIEMHKHYIMLSTWKARKEGERRPIKERMQLCP
jgi:hypothetical protein